MVTVNEVNTKFEAFGLEAEASKKSMDERLYTMADAVQVAAQIEEEAKKKTSMRFTTTSYGKNERPAIDLRTYGLPMSYEENLHVGIAQGKEAAEQESDLAGNSFDFGVYEADDLADDEDAIT
ncbi:unnamed protein product [Dovyalis caffra]|uniref:Uncharacterized protein n=1 Tax=Dovyalis caffra TaxID=77055 RepID=A0AAV1SPD0_9ROSI|nr:unnamed protein product [Dovyalis caffra]